MAISAELGLITSDIVVKVIPILTHIIVTPGNQDVKKGSLGQVEATAYYSDKSTYNVTEEVQWSSSDESVAQMPFSNGMVLATGIGDATITAKYETKENTATIHVYDDVYIIDGEDTLPAYQSTPSVDVTYTLLKNSSPTDGNWILEDATNPNNEAIKITPSGRLTINPALNVPEHFVIIASDGSNETRKSISTYKAMIQITDDVTNTINSGTIGMKNINSDRILAIMNGLYPVNTESWLSKEYPTGGGHLGSTFMYGRSEKINTGPGDPDTARAPTISLCREAPCRNHDETHEYETGEWHTKNTAYGPN